MICHSSWNKSILGITLLTSQTVICLQAFDSETGFLRWSISFDVPPVAAYSSVDASVNQLDPSAASPESLRVRSGEGEAAGEMVPAPQRRDYRGKGGASVPSSVVPGRLQSCSANTEQGPDGCDGEGQQGQPGTRVLVGVLAGSPYAMPADHLVFDENDGFPAAPPPLAISGATEDVGSTSDPGHEGLERGDSKALAPVSRTRQDAVLGLMRPIGSNGGLGNSGLLCPTGLHTITMRSDNSSEGDIEQISWLPNITSSSASVTAEKQLVANVPAVAVIGRGASSVTSHWLFRSILGAVLIAALTFVILFRGGMWHDSTKPAFSAVPNGSGITAAASSVVGSTLMPPLQPLAKGGGKSRRKGQNRETGGNTITAGPTHKGTGNAFSNIVGGAALVTVTPQEQSSVGGSVLPAGMESSEGAGASFTGRSEVSREMMLGQALTGEAATAAAREARRHGSSMTSRLADGLI